MLVECKAPGEPDYAGLDQVRSYAHVINPAYYLITNGNLVVVYLYQGTIVPDARVLEFRRSELSEHFDELYSRINRESAREARLSMMARFAAVPTAK